MKNILKISPDSGAKDYNVVNKDEDNVYVHKKRIDIDPSLSVAGDIAFYDKDNDKVIIVSQSNWSITDCPADKFEPIGVVVVPGTHNVYGDGSCGVMSLKSMNCADPENGSSSNLDGPSNIVRMYWGRTNVDIFNLPNLNLAPTGNTEDGIPVGQTVESYLPSDEFSTTQCLHDTDAYYYDSPYAPSPYLTDGSRNPGYYQTISPSSSNNCLADFDGRGNTDKIITVRGNEDYSSWKPTYDAEADYPAASCCDMFYTEGTQQGDWYLPACGELGYIMPPFNKINEAITKMRNAYRSSVGVTVSTSNRYWSSSEYSNNSARNIDTDDGYVDYYGKNNSNYVRAFLRVGADGVVRS